VLLLDYDGKERERLEGYLPNEDFVAALERGLGVIAFVDEKYTDAEVGTPTRRQVLVIPILHLVRCTGGQLPVRSEELRSNYPFSVWSSKAMSWLPGACPAASAMERLLRTCGTQIVGKVRLYSGGGQVVNLTEKWFALASAILEQGKSAGSESWNWRRYA